jgi:hypothetical protein
MESTDQSPVIVVSNDQYQIVLLKSVRVSCDASTVERYQTHTWLVRTSMFLYVSAYMVAYMHALTEEQCMLYTEY